MTRNVDVVVLGAGIVGVSAALQLQERGRTVALVDRRQEAGEETSFGNSGLIENSSLLPYTFPRELRTLLRYSLNRSTDAVYHLRSLPVVGPWLLKYRAESSPQSIARTAAASRPLIDRCLSEHDAFATAAGAEHLLRRVGWMRVYRKEASLSKAAKEAAFLTDRGMHVRVLDPAAVGLLEPAITREVVGGVHFEDSVAVSDPGSLVKAYAELFSTNGGYLLRGDARTLQQSGARWTVSTDEGPLTARDVVLAMGPWAADVFEPLGYKIPLGIKRGYHVHFERAPGSDLTRPVVDADGGYLLAPMKRGIRLTTGAEFALRDSNPTPVQLRRAEPKARTLLPLGKRVEAQPWMGSRPCLPDMLPVLGPAPRHKGLWFDFGHQHLGLTLGPVCGRLLAELVTGEEPFTDPMPFDVRRFETGLRGSPPAG